MNNKIDKIKKNQLADELVDFCIKYKLLNITGDVAEVQKNVEIQLEESSFVEGLIKWLISETKYRRNIDYQKLKELLIELEKIKLDFDYEEE